jgi:hypothetical protein
VIRCATKFPRKGQGKIITPEEKALSLERATGKSLVEAMCGVVMCPILHHENHWVLGLPGLSSWDGKEHVFFVFGIIAWLVAS